MITRLKLMLSQEEYLAIYRAARDELRNPADEARHILRQALAQRGLLKDEQPQREAAEPEIAQ